MGLQMDLKSLGTVYGTLMFLRPAFQELLPPYVRKFIRDIFYWLLPYIRKEKFTIDIDGGCYGTDGFSDVQTYLSSKCFDSINHMKTTIIGKPNKANYTIAPDGKTSSTAAIANYLKFDIYDMELTSVKTNSHLRNLLIATKSKSVIVIEDFDCSLDFSTKSNTDDEQENTDGDDNDKGRSSRADKEKKMKVSDVSLSGVLNFVDGLWSSCGGERLIIFTTNYKERLDPALLRPGRMDEHIHLSFCDFESFKVLAKNYLQIREHEIMNEVKELLKFVQITPADVAEFLMSCDDDADIGLGNLVKELKKRLESIKKEDTTEQNDKEAAIKQEKEEAFDNSEKMKEEEEKDDDHVEIDSDSDSESDSDSGLGSNDSDY
ncbi:AAA-ATPase At3g28510-like [Papaver somniferum]|uniref:AAA-ATPase At3g28510-like n=1 Tax=Papaver somniferum TaxID=3469 RepID=UPI000E701CD6|nr:AAA-ATPase At3g28510-like [Papaver somniferum]